MKTTLIHNCVLIRLAQGIKESTSKKIYIIFSYGQNLAF